MSELLTRDLIADKAIIYDTHPVDPRTNAPRGFFDQTFELPARLFAASLALFVAFLAVMTVGFGNPELILPMAIFGIFFAGFYGIPVLFVRQAPNESNTGQSWREFKAQGVQTLTGRLPASEAAIQMLILPVLILAWGIACVTIAALV
ncbi:hypothetical protein [Erythrobacter litoralis]|uniref:Uncharacterized protein n=1 Tax=Erythrobacter litoralis (strain HTCC2594) TaxID=314225 RepID=Q2NCE0_ERYLH|nr:hypothetical protein [Erythrobacter litoralis]ABC62651.1 hypothetical protein ELI_02795 [Erythrobacter litoralis HTCC2594]